VAAAGLATIDLFVAYRTAFTDSELLNCFSVSTLFTIILVSAYVAVTSCQFLIARYIFRISFDFFYLAKEKEAEPV